MSLPKFDLSETSDFTKFKLAILLDEFNRRQKSELWKYEPLPIQERFHKSNASIRLFIGGNRSGKTYAGVVESIWLAMGEHPYKKIKTPNVGWIVALDFPNYIEPIILPMIHKMLPDYMIKRDYTSKERSIELPNGSLMYFKSVESGEEKFQGAAVDWEWVDEEPPEAIDKELSYRRMSTNGIIFYTMTPTNGMSWSYEKIYLEGKKFNEADQVKTELRTDVFEANTYENKYLDPTVIKFLEGRCSTQEEKEMRIYGHYVSLGGQSIFSKEQLDTLTKHQCTPEFKGDILNGQFVRWDGEEEAPLWMWEDYQEGATYIAGCDSTGGMGDYMALEIWKASKGKLTQVLEYNFKVPPEIAVKRVLDVCRYFGNPLLNIERNSTGMALIALIRPDYYNLYTEENEDGQKFGMVASTHIGTYTSEKMKDVYIAQTKDMLSQGVLEIKSERLARQAEAYIRNAKGKITASHGHDDLVSATMLSVHAVSGRNGYFLKPHEIFDGGKLNAGIKNNWLAITNWL